MYPQSPTLQEWRKAAADKARAAGVPVPSWYDGSQDAVSRLNTEATDINAAITWMQNAYVVANPGLFPAQNLEYSKNWLAKNPERSAWAAGFKQLDTGFLALTGDFVDELGNQVVDLNDKVNPFSETNRKRLFWLGVLGVGLYLAAPHLAKEGKKVIAKATK